MVMKNAKIKAVREPIQVSHMMFGSLEADAETNLIESSPRLSLRL